MSDDIKQIRVSRWMIIHVLNIPSKVSDNDPTQEAMIGAKRGIIQL